MHLNSVFGRSGVDIVVKYYESWGVEVAKCVEKFGIDVDAADLSSICVVFVLQAMRQHHALASLKPWASTS